MTDSPFTEPLPWEDTMKWDKNFWYPLPLGFMERDNDNYIVDGYGIFCYDRLADNGDILPVFDQRFLFSNALEICEQHNGVPLV